MAKTDDGGGEHTLPVPGLAGGPPEPPPARGDLPGGHRRGPRL